MTDDIPPDVRKAVLERDNYRCRRCGVEDGLSLHHIIQQHVSLTVSAQADHVEVSVKDSGIGLAADMLKSIFGVFTQGHPGTRYALGGLGIGLALVKSLVELHGGYVEARSEGPGRGSEFVVRLPISARRT